MSEQKKLKWKKTNRSAYVAGDFLITKEAKGHYFLIKKGREIAYCRKLSIAKQCAEDPIVLANHKI